MTGKSKYDQQARVFDYSADGGSLLIGTPAFNAGFDNGYGDGCFQVVIDDGEGRHDDDGWDFVDSIGGDGDFHVYPYDCEATNPLVTITGRWAVYRASDGTGDMRLVSWGGTVKEVTAVGGSLDSYSRFGGDDNDIDDVDDPDDIDDDDEEDL